MTPHHPPPVSHDRDCSRTFSYEMPNTNDCLYTLLLRLPQRACGRVVKAPPCYPHPSRSGCIQAVGFPACVRLASGAFSFAFLCRTISQAESRVTLRWLWSWSMMSASDACPSPSNPAMARCGACTLSDATLQSQDACAGATARNHD